MESKMKFRVLGNNISYDEACNLKIPEGWKLVEFNDLQEIMNYAGKCGIGRGEYYFFSQMEKRNKKLCKLNSLWLGGLDGYSEVGGFRGLNSDSRARGVLIVKKKR